MKNLKQIMAASLALFSSAALLTACSEPANTRPAQSQSYPEGTVFCALIKDGTDGPCKLHRVKEFDGVCWETDCGYHNDFDEAGGYYTYHEYPVYTDIERIYTPQGIKFSDAEYTIGPATAYNLNEYTLCPDCYPQQTKETLNK